MKKTIFTALAFLGLSTLTFAQQDELKAAAASLEKKDYVAALDALTKAKKVVSDLMADNLATVLPAKFGEYTIEKDPYGGGMDMGAINLVRVYRKPKPVAAATEKPDGVDPAMASMPDPAMMMGGQEELRVQITTNMMMASEVMSAHAGSEAGMPGGEGVKAIRVKGYRAITKTMGGTAMGQSEQQSREQAQAIVGAAFVSIEAIGMKEKGQAEKLLNLIDFEKLVSILGK